MRHGALQGHHNVRTRFVTIGNTVQKFKSYRQTNKETGTALRCWNCGL